LNGVMKGDEKGEYTYVSQRGCSVIDYVIVNDSGMEIMNSFKGERWRKVDSDHMPLSVELKGNGRKKEEEETEEEQDQEGKRIVKICWNEEAIKLYERRTDELEWIEKEGESIEEKWQRLKDLVNSTMVKEEYRRRKRKLGFKDWWDRSCTKKKRLVHRQYRRWKSGKVNRESYVEERKKMKEHLGKKKEEWLKREEVVMKSLKNGAEIWKYINKKRGKRRNIENDIDLEKWAEHFERLLDGEKVNTRRKKKEDRSQETKEKGKRKEDDVEEEREEIQEEEIGKVVLGMKRKKAAGIDGIPMEAWRFGGKAVRKGLVELLKQVWREKE